MGAQLEAIINNERIRGLRISFTLFAIQKLLWYHTKRAAAQLDGNIKSF